MIQIKTCTNCKKNLQATTDYFRTKKGGKYGLYAKCKECEKEEKQKYYLENKDAYKTYHKNNSEKIKVQQHEYYNQNKERLNAYATEYHKQNRERAYFLHKRWREENKEKWNKHLIRYRKSETGKTNIQVKNLKRYYKTANAKNDFTNIDWQNCLKHFENKCAYCEVETKLTQDHFIPVSKNGSLSKENIIPACKFCNTSKSNKDFSLWYLKQNFYSEKRIIKILNYIENQKVG